MQLGAIFNAQGITDYNTRINYASTALAEGALHWYLNRLMSNSGGIPWHNWDDFATEMKAAFQPPQYQQYLRDQLRRCHQTGSVQEYTTRFRNIMGQIEEMGELDKVNAFSDGLKLATRQEVKYQAPSTLEEAWKLAV